jgi:hypothetical protein
MYVTLLALVVGLALGTLYGISIGRKLPPP